MGKSLNASIISVALAVAPASWLAMEEAIKQDIVKDSAKSELSIALNDSNAREKMTMWVDVKVFVEAALSYFDEEVKLYHLKWEARQKVKNLLLSYFSAHPILVVDNAWNMMVKIDDKVAFSNMIRNLTYTLLDGMPAPIRTIAVFIAFGWNSGLEKQLKDLDVTLYNMKVSNYRNIVFDYVGWIITRVANEIGWNMTLKDYYNNVSTYYSNKNWEQISNELREMKLEKVDIKNLKYPFKK